jgi:hypothetical protein
MRLGTFSGVDLADFGCSLLEEAEAAGVTEDDLARAMVLVVFRGLVM